MKIYKKNEKGKNNRKVIFLLTGWRNRLWMYWPFAKILSLNGFYCITYAYDDEIFSPDTAKTVRYLTEVRDDVLITIKKLKKEGTKDFSIFGTSLGSMIALMIANNSKGVSKIILNTTGSDIAEIVWSWNKIFSWFKEDLLEQGFILDKLEKVWSSITPKNNTDQLKNKQILIYLSEKDKIIPVSYGMQLVKEFQKRNYTYTLVVNKKLGHILTASFNLVNAHKYLTFLKE